ncbi:hypothetical protein HID58_012865 [Brassica napus]|uniref:Uncharacterized protein n=1 Tax=Brassica napus TaxID=3708 RepID=A0ABQ8E2Q8_BRANA|nr:hypothetical protein HID58_012865 [Brassica napus]
MKLKANNAIFYIIFKGNGDPSGAPVEYQAVSDLRPFLPLEIKKVTIQTKEESQPCMNLKANNAIFYIIFKGNGDPSGAPVEYQAVIRDEPPQQRKRKLESPGSAVATPPIQSFPKVDYDHNPWDDDEVDSVIEKEYHRQFVESDGFDVDHFYLPYGGGQVPHIMENKYDYPYDVGLFSRLGLHCYNLEKGTSLKLAAINKYNDKLRFTRCLCYHITLEAIDTSNNSLCNFQTCVFKDFLPEQASFLAQTEISRLKVPSGPRPPTYGGPDRRWKDDAVDDSYKGKMPKWFTNDEMAAISTKGQFYELQESDLQGNEWLHMYAEFAFHSKWIAHASDLRPFLPLEIKKVTIQTKEESQPCMKLKANNAIFYIIFKGNGDPSGAPVEYQAVVRKTMDGIPGHICLEVDCLAYKSS